MPLHDFGLLEPGGDIEKGIMMASLQLADGPTLCGTIVLVDVYVRVFIFASVMKQNLPQC